MSNCNLTLIISLIQKLLDTVKYSLIIVSQNAINTHFKESACLLRIIRPEHVTLNTMLVAFIHKIFGKGSILDKLNLVEVIFYRRLDHFLVALARALAVTCIRQ